jgi:hypothetical protein
VTARIPWFILVILGTYAAIRVLFPSEPGDESTRDSADTSYSPGPTGTKALYLLLEDVGLPVSRLRRPDYRNLRPGTALWNLSTSSLGGVERAWVLDFVRAGGTFLAGPIPMEKLMSEASLGTPTFDRMQGELASFSGPPVESERFSTVSGLSAPDRMYITVKTHGKRDASSEPTSAQPVVAAWTYGKGRLVYLGIRDAAVNENIGLSSNGAFFADLAFDSGQSQVFDEFATGFGDLGLMTLLARAPYRWALAQVVLSLTVLLLALALRRRPAETPTKIRRRQTSDHVDAVARLWARNGDAGLPLDSLMRAANDRARARLEISGVRDPFVRWVALVRPELAERARVLWTRAQGLTGEPRPSVVLAQGTAAELIRLEKEALSW